MDLQGDLSYPEINFEDHINIHMVSFNDQLDTLNSKILSRLTSLEVNFDNDDGNSTELLPESEDMIKYIDKYKTDIEKASAEYQTLKNDKELLAKEVKETYDAFVQAKGFYKSGLKIYFKVESMSKSECRIFVQFFTTNPLSGEQYSVRLVRCNDTKTYRLLETKPSLRNFAQLKKKLEETNDVIGLLTCIRKIFKITYNK